MNRRGFLKTLGVVGVTQLSQAAYAATPTLANYYPTVAAMKAAPAPPGGTQAQTSGYYSAGDGGGAFYYWNAADTSSENGGTVIALDSRGTGRWNMVYGLEVSVLQFGAKGDCVFAGTGTDDTAAIQAAIKAIAAKTFGGTVWFPAKLFLTTSPINVPDKVNLRGDKVGITNNAGTAWEVGTGIYKAHSGSGVTITSNNMGTLVQDIALLSNNSTYAGGSGWVVGPARNVRLIRCNAFKMGADSFVLGDNTLNSYMNSMFDCYSNNPLGRNFVCGSEWGKMIDIVSDGGTISLEVQSTATYTVARNVHSETIKTQAMKIGAGNFVLDGRSVLLLNDGTVQGIILLNNSGVSNAVISNVFMTPPGATPGRHSTVGVHLAGRNNVACTVRSCVIQGFDTGILDAGADNELHNNDLYANTLQINANGSGGYYYHGNTIVSTGGSYSIVHNAGTSGLWTGNNLDKTINAAMSGTPGNFSGIRVKDNVGYVSRNSGRAAGVSSPAGIRHGLAGVPSQVLVSTTTSGLSNIHQTGADASAFELTWSGGTGTFNWTANLPCDP
jgi:hypothetical protein